LSPAKRGAARSDEPQALGSVLDALGREGRLGAGLLLGTLGRRWGAVVGERLAEESTPAALNDGVLLVRASSSAWATQIKFLSKEIKDAANRILATGEAPGHSGKDAGVGAGRRPIREVRVVLDAGPRTG
jgi:predicted nucleic acid-binding Zn ribbon protein